MQLYSYFRSSASFRVRIALELKGLAYDYLPVHLLKNEQLQAPFADLNPSSRAISARVGGMPVSEINRCTKRRICVWRGVRSDIAATCSCIQLL